jgi:glyceraldehyde-3-phosphate dehydrogenase (NAD(P))
MVYRSNQKRKLGYKIHRFHRKKIEGRKMSRKIVHVVGTGTIGEPLIGLLCDYREQLGIDDITFHKNTPNRSAISKVQSLMHRGARLAVDESKFREFKSFNMDADFITEEAIKRATVVIDCTPKGIGQKNKEAYYHKFGNEVRGFLAQGSEHGFGKKYARGINDKALKPEDKFIQIVSCNTHNLSCITKTIALYGAEDNLVSGKFVCIRRANDISQPTGFIPAPQVERHLTNEYGSHHAEDAANLFLTLNINLNLFSSAMKINSQYMHVMWFNLKLKEPVKLSDIKDRLQSNPYVALTEKNMTSTVFSFGRDQGHYGRILNQSVVVDQTLTVHDDHEVTGFCFTPQDGNSILSSISATEWLLYPHSYEDKIRCLSELFFDHI